MTTSVSPRPAVGTAPAPALPPRLVGLAILALSVGGFTIGTTEFVTMGLLPEMARGVGVSIPRAGHVISAYALGVVVGAPLIAVLGARLPRKGLLLALMVAYGARQRRHRAGALVRSPWPGPASWPGCRTARTSGWPRWSPPGSCPPSARAGP